MNRTQQTQNDRVAQTFPRDLRLHRIEARSAAAHAWIRIATGREHSSTDVAGVADLVTMLSGSDESRAKVCARPALLEPESLPARRFQAAGKFSTG